MASSVSAASLPHKKRKSSNASSDVESETGRLLNSLGSPGSSLADVGTGLQGGMTPPKPQGPSSLEATHVHFPNDLPHLHSSHDEEESASQNGSSKAPRNLPERRLQPKKRKMSMESFDMSFVDTRRKMSHESYDSAMGDSALGLNSASMDSSILPKLPDVSSLNSKNSGGSGQVKEQQQQYDHAPMHGVSALEHLDALGDEKADLPKTADKMPKAPAKSEDEDKKPAAVDKRQRVDSFGHLEDDDRDDNTSNDTFTSSGHRLLMEAIMMSSGQAGLDGAGRKRLESWGGMSDLSFGGDQGNAAAAIAASALHHTGIIDDVTAAANFGDDSVNSSVTDMEHWRPVPPFKRDRKESSTSFSDSTFPFPASLESVEVSSDLQKFVAAAVASVGDQLAELAGAVESAASGADIDSYSKKGLGRARLDSETSSIATPVVIGASVEDGSTGAEKHLSIAQQEDDTTKALEAAATAAAISVDYDAVAAAVDAAQAATGALDLSAIDENTHSVFHTSAASVSSRIKGKRKLPVHNRKQHDRDAIEYSAAPDQPVSASAFHSMPPPKSTLSEAEQEAIRERARRAAGYVPPAEQGKTPQKQSLPPLKKRKKLTPESESAKTFSHETPRVSNISQKPDIVPSEIFSGLTPPAGNSSHPVSGSKAAAVGQSTQKWESMFDCLLEFIAERKQEELTGATQEENDAWQWDGNVPTTYKTKDGKALGRWINNQRSAKSKGTLKKDREKRLVDAGLKWSVLASNSWNEMLDELRDYVTEYTKDGKKWDGNVPTNYRIKAKPNGKKLTEEDKNLGRWVNRQRSLFQAGKLRKDRQLALEKIGLKWSMLATTSWDSMFETLVEYVQQKTKDGSKWDGNVPANYRTDDNPPRALGRWINRQRSANVKKKLKQEYVEKLSNLGLKWSVHERRFADDRDVQSSAPVRPDDAPSSAPTSDAIPSTIAVPASVADNTPGNDRASEVETSNVDSSGQKEELGSGVARTDMEVDQRKKTVAGARKTDNAESSATATESRELEIASDISTEKSHNCEGTMEEVTKTTHLTPVEPDHHVEAGLRKTREAKASMEAAKSDTIVEADEPKQSQTKSIAAQDGQNANGPKEGRRSGEISAPIADIAVIGKKSDGSDANLAKSSSELTQTVQNGGDPSSNDPHDQEFVDEKQMKSRTVSKHVNDVNAEVKMRGTCESKSGAAKAMVVDEREANLSPPIDGSASPAKEGNERVLSVVLSPKSSSLSSAEKGSTEKQTKTASENADSSSKSVHNDSDLRETGCSGKTTKEESASKQATETESGNTLCTDGPKDLPLGTTSGSGKSKGGPVQGNSNISVSEALSAPMKEAEKAAVSDDSHRRQEGTSPGDENPKGSETANKPSQSGANYIIADKDEDTVKAGKSRRLLGSATNREQQPKVGKLETKRDIEERKTNNCVKQTNKAVKENNKPMTWTSQSKIDTAEKPVTRSTKASKKASDTRAVGREIEQSSGRSVERRSTRRSRRKAQRVS